MKTQVKTKEQEIDLLAKSVGMRAMILTQQSKSSQYPRYQPTKEHVKDIQRVDRALQRIIKMS